MDRNSRNNPGKHGRQPDSAQRRGGHAASAAPPASTITRPSRDTGGSLVSRRAFLYGAIGAGAAVVVGGGAAAMGAFSSKEDDEILYLRVPESSLTTLDKLEALDSHEECVTLAEEFEVPYGTLIWVSDDDVAACLLPTETGSPLAQIGLLFLGSGRLDTVCEAAVEKDGDYEIYDVRATSHGVIWTEADIMQGTWRVYAAPLQNGELGQPMLLDEGDSAYEAPTLAAVGNHAIWQKVPRDASDAETTSKLMSASFDSAQSTCLYESRGRSATPVYAGSDNVVIAPRIDSPTVHYQLTCIDLDDGQVVDTLTLPQNMKPLEAGYGKTGFMFSFPDIYDYGEGISNLGTYVPCELPADGDYSNVRWFSFARTPSAAPAWAGDLLIVKSTMSVCGIGLDKGEYFAIELENGADTYGEYLATSGDRSSFVTYTNVDHAPIDGEAVHACKVKLWHPIAP